MSSGALPPEVEARQQLTTGLLQWLLSLDSGVEWAERILRVQPLASGLVRYSLVERRADGEYTEDDVLADSVGEAVRTLQQYMYAPSAGTWLTADFSVTAEARGDARFNFDEQPRVPGPDGAEGGMSADEVAAHLQTFPRPDEAVPGWMRNRG